MTRNIPSILTALSPPPVAPPEAVQEDPAQIPRKQSRPVQEREEQLMSKQMPLGPQSGPMQPTLRQLSPKHYRLGNPKVSYCPMLNFIFSTYVSSASVTIAAAFAI
jgi:hypothetical protein